MKTLKSCISGNPQVLAQDIAPINVGSDNTPFEFSMNELPFDSTHPELPRQKSVKFADSVVNEKTEVISQQTNNKEDSVNPLQVDWLRKCSSCDTTIHKVGGKYCWRCLANSLTD
eukprot:NODE_8137_length_706_cov_37.610635_g7518_i0.p1 GENE.NODE_8137_length_706_cov_37.610635_g7518_i0~~NODE_8137_length_706_cov_37.610635_g7518_i0.p1  ORF type:complete len:115 (+),score=16.70 NODE_8137_length_706_cov_37.610635_g7518_i0:185-529(+)